MGVLSDQLQALAVKVAALEAGVPPVVVPPGIPPTPPATGVPPKGVQWHSDFLVPWGKNSFKNFNWLMDKYGSSWAFAYMDVSLSPSLSNYVGTNLPDGNAVINTFRNAGNMGPAGMIIPFGTKVVNQVLSSFKPLVTIPLPFPDDDVISTP